MAVVTFEQARAVVDREFRPDWPARLGTFMVAEYGREDDDDYFVVAGAREYLVGGDSDYVLMDWPALFVSKATGALATVPVISVFRRLDRMRPVGAPAPS
jgi:hypothetical protein